MGLGYNQDKDRYAFQPPYKRDWNAELYDYFIVYLLNWEAYDPYGMTEKLTLAWCSPSARRVRYAHWRCVGPHGVFLNTSFTPRGLGGACMLELGTAFLGLSWLPLL